MQDIKIRHYLHYEDENKMALLVFYDERDYSKCIEKAINIIEIISAKIMRNIIKR